MTLDYDLIIFYIKVFFSCVAVLTLGLTLIRPAPVKKSNSIQRTARQSKLPSVEEIENMNQVIPHQKNQKKRADEIIKLARKNPQLTANQVSQWLRDKG
ncbi:MAG: hypothetical protein COB67_09065 [SAR324 cluster bacterium]|uniref:Uncharacterized protein n=1 Tax=SAR324 cluster bacterium TaxID=2024889 RepID=A0A2A4T0N3_9DELT|nr:MAG: hypothetical protein COB67_09065 [SAR324 cluster bacterium]